MAAPTVTAQNDRLRAIMAAYSGMGTDCSEGAAIAALPAFICNPLETTERVQIAPKRWMVTRNIEIIGMISLMPDLTKLSNRLTSYQNAMDVCEAWMEWINRHPRLLLNDSGLVHATGELLDGGFGAYTYGERDYSAFRLQLPVITARP